MQLLTGKKGEIPSGQGIRLNGEKYMHVQTLKAPTYQAKVRQQLQDGALGLLELCWLVGIAGWLNILTGRWAFRPLLTSYRLLWAPHSPTNVTSSFARFCVHVYHSTCRSPTRRAT